MGTLAEIVLVWLIIGVFLFPKLGTFSQSSQKNKRIKKEPVLIFLFFPLMLFFLLFKLATKLWKQKAQKKN